jgi:hypothetical protein
MLLDAYTKQEILRSEPFSSAFRPNRAILMTIMYAEPEEIRRCPRCLRDSSEQEDELIHW